MKYVKFTGPYADFVELRITDDNMSAYMTLKPNDEPDFYNQSKLLNLLTENQIIVGVDLPKIREMIESKCYSLPFCVAKGKPAVNGDNGFFTYHFKTSVDNTPKIRADGSVDYSNSDMFEPAHKGDILATYTPATPGTRGVNILGRIINPAHGVDERPLTGKGFTLSEDKLTYTSDIDGKVEITKQNELVVSALFEYNGSLELGVGNVDFVGDVIIRGDVRHGVTVRAGGNLVVHGNVEDAYLYSKGDMTLQGGMQGAMKGKIECQGNLNGKFFEQASILCQGNITCNSMMNCKVVSNGSIFVAGKHGLIVGGSVCTLGSVRATSIGNLAEVRTEISVGSNPEALAEIKEAEYGIADTASKLSKIDAILEKLEAIVHPTDEEKLKIMMKQSLSTKQYLTDLLASQRAELEEKHELLRKASNSIIAVDKYIYRNVCCNVNGLYLAITEPRQRVIVHLGGERGIEIADYPI